MGTQCSSYCGTCQKNDKMIVELDPSEVNFVGIMCFLDYLDSTSHF